MTSDTGAFGSDGGRTAGEDRGDAAAGAEAACLAALERALVEGGSPELAHCTRAALDGALRELIRRRGAAAGPLLRALAERAPAKDLRKTAKAAIYRLEQSGISVPAPTPASAPPLVARRTERAARSWLSGIDGSGSRAAWILFEGGVGGEMLLCSLLLNDESGILEVAGGPISKKRLERELAALREDQKLPWVESDPAHACSLVAETLELHARLGTEPAAGFARWRRFFAGAIAPALDAAAHPDPALLERSAELAQLPELAGWFVDPAQVQEDGLALLQARESRLVVSDQIKAERESAIVDQAIERLFTGDARRRWARRLEEMALIFRATDRDEQALIAGAAASAVGDEAREARAIPLVRALALRGLEVAAEVALGRVKLADVTRAPVRRPRE